MLTYDGFKSHVNVTESLTTFYGHKICVVKEGASMLHVNQAYNQSQAKEDKRATRQILELSKTRVSSHINQYQLCGIICVALKNLPEKIGLICLKLSIYTLISGYDLTYGWNKLMITSKQARQPIQGVKYKSNCIARTITFNLLRVMKKTERFWKTEIMSFQWYIGILVIFGFMWWIFPSNKITQQSCTLNTNNIYTNCAKRKNPARFKVFYF